MANGESIQIPPQLSIVKQIKKKEHKDRDRERETVPSVLCGILASRPCWMSLCKTGPNSSARITRMIQIRHPKSLSGALLLFLPYSSSTDM